MSVLGVQAVPAGHAFRCMQCVERKTMFDREGLRTGKQRVGTDFTLTVT